MRSHRLTLLLLSRIALAACTMPGPGAQQTDATEDRYLSDRLAEFRIDSVGQVAAPSLAEAVQRAPLKARAMAAYLTVLLRQKHSHYDHQNLDYGDFNGLVRNESVEQMNIRPGGDGRYVFDVQMLAAAPSDLLERLAEHPYAVRFDPLVIRVPMQVLSDLDVEQVATGAMRIDDFNPDKVPTAELEWFEATLRSEPVAADAYPDYWGLWKGGPAAPGFESTGTLDVAVFYGFDEGGADTDNASETWKWMQGEGFELPVSSFEQLAIDSPPAELDFLTDGGRLAMRLRLSLVHSRVVGATDAALRQRFVDALAQADVIIYNGHAWLYQGFYLGQGAASAIESDEIPSLYMPADRSQIVVANGCATYANYAGRLYQIAGKSPENLDVLTTINVSAIKFAPAFVQIVVQALSSRAPQSYLGLLSVLNADERYLDYPTVFGVHGIEDNPRAHPFADFDLLCQPCQQRTDCGHSTGTSCVAATPGAERSCATVCLDDSGCPDGYACLPAADATERRYCMPALDSICSGAPGGGEPPNDGQIDPCDKYDLYGDGLCDQICFHPDPDCP